MLATPTASSAEHLDVLFARQGPITLSAGLDFDAGGAVVETRVFSRSLVYDPPVWVGSDPGFTAGASGLPSGWTALPPNVPVPFAILWERTLGWNLTWWNGAGSPSFGPAPDGEVLVIDQNGCVSCAQAVANGGGDDVAGFALGQTSGSGSLHQHHDYFLLGDLALSDEPTPGIYLIALTAQAGTLDWTAPFFVLLGAGATPAQLAAAKAWVAANLVLTACSDGIDNDGDGLIDRLGGPDGEPADTGCTGPSATSERPPPSCGLGLEMAFLLPIWAWRRRARTSAP